MNVTPSSTGLSAILQQTKNTSPAPKEPPPPPKPVDYAGQREATKESLQSRLVENHGFEMKKYTRDALANNTKIINTPPLERGSLLDVRV